MSFNSTSKYMTKIGHTTYLEKTSCKGREIYQMASKLKKFVIVGLILASCQTSNDMDEYNLNTLDLTRITGETPKNETFLSSAFWTAVVGAALLAALSSDSTYSSKTGMDSTELDSEWIE